MFENLKAFLISVVPYERAMAIIEALVTLKATGTPGMEQFVSETLAMVDDYDNYTIVDFIGEYTLQRQIDTVRSFGITLDVEQVHQSHTALLSLVIDSLYNVEDNDLLSVLADVINAGQDSNECFANMMEELLGGHVYTILPMVTQVSTKLTERVLSLAKEKEERHISLEEIDVTERTEAVSKRVSAFLAKWPAFSTVVKAYIDDHGVLGLSPVSLHQIISPAIDDELSATVIAQELYLLALCSDVTDAGVEKVAFSFVDKTVSDLGKVAEVAAALTALMIELKKAS